MISPSEFAKELDSIGLNFYTGVPDSLLKNFSSYLDSADSVYSHYICANEGNALAMGIGYHLATQRYCVCYLQNSGLGNLVNPYLSLAHESVYSIPSLLLIGWRGEPNSRDEPQHVIQGETTLGQLELLSIPYLPVGPSSIVKDISKWVHKSLIIEKKTCALLISKNTFSNADPLVSSELFCSKTFFREEALKQIISEFSSSIFVSTTGKTSREVDEIIRAMDNPPPAFLVIGGMGHASSIAMGIALSRKNEMIVCLDGDGSLLMHMGSLAINGSLKASNFYYILLNNGCHESVGCQPTVARNIDFKNIASSVGFKNYFKASTLQELCEVLPVINNDIGATFLEVEIQPGSRNTLSRPTRLPIDSKINFFKMLSGF